MVTRREPVLMQSPPPVGPPTFSPKPSSRRQDVMK